MRAIVVFSDGDHPGRWWHRLFAPGFKHVECFLEMWPSRWVGVAGGCGDLFVLPMPEGFDPWRFAMDRGMTATDTTAAPGNGGWRVLGRADCVAVIKAALGIRDWRILTPKQLFDRL